MNKRCLYCYEPFDKDAGKNAGDFHKHCSLAFFGTPGPPRLEYSLDQMAELAKNVVERSVTIPGVQPKLSLSLVKDVIGDGSLGRLTVVGALGGKYILKPPSVQFPEMPGNEHLTMRIAETFGIRTVQSSLIRLASGELSYITKRIDRTDAGGKIHMLDMFQVTEAHDKYKSSLEKIGKAINQYSANTGLDKLYFFEISLFCFLTGNNDMHLKNFSMINRNSSWTLAPFYDLLNVTIVNPADTEELALTLEGKKKKIKAAHFIRLAEGMGLLQKQFQSVFTRFNRLKNTAGDWIDKSFLSENYKEKYRVLLNDRYDRIMTEMGSEKKRAAATSKKIKSANNRNPKFQVFRGSNGDYYFHLRAANSDVILSGEGYTNKQTCLNGIASVKSNASLDERYQRISKPGYKFNLKSANAEIIGRSEIYQTLLARETGIEAVKRDAPGSPIEDLS